MKRILGVCFDIDGVILRGKNVLPGAKTAIDNLTKSGIPFVFMTNGGGHLESYRSKLLSNYLEREISEEKVILAHTPMRTLVPKYHDKRILVLGCREELLVARHYGFSKVVSPQEFCAQHKNLYPFRNEKRTVDDPFEDEPINAILIMHDPVDWHLEIQVCVDILMGRDPLFRETSNASHSMLKQRVPVYNSNQDFVFSGAYKYPRFAQGAFLLSLQHLYGLSTGGSQLEVGRFGKPHKSSFDHAVSLLRKQCNGVNNFDEIYMIGDNIHSDILGARNSGKPWQSILVESGISNENEDVSIADHVCPDVGKAVDLVLKRQTCT